MSGLGLKTVDVAEAEVVVAEVAYARNTKAGEKERSGK